MNKLIKDAKSYRPERKGNRTKITKDHVELAISFLKREVTLTQTAVALYGSSSKVGHGTYAVLLRSLQQAYELGKLKVNSK